MANEATASIDHAELLAKVQEMYRAVAETPERQFHFETGRALAERLGYLPDELDAIPAEAIESFAGVGYFFDLAGLQPGESVLDLGSGSGMDAFIAALRVGDSGHVVGVDMTEQQLHKANRLREEHGLSQTSFRFGHIEQLDLEDGSFDVVISNGVINLAPDKDQVFREAARTLRPGGRLAMADIVTEVPLTEAIVSDVDLWASCIGGAPEQQAYQDAMARAGLHVELMKANTYEFLSEQARGASDRYGVKSVSVLAVKKA
jgi:ubiquinone/menaquinone biosynthesis C-methylase UbiE